MRTISRVIPLLLAVFMAVAPRAAAQGGSIEFVAHATPSGGIEEPVRGFPFYLLSKSFQDIRKEADASITKPDMDAFIDKLEVSDELKVWMKRNHWVNLSGVDFTHKLNAESIIGVPEFYKAYTDRESSDQSAHFPKPKYKPDEKAKNPDKYNKEFEEYRTAVAIYIKALPDSIDGIDLNLEDINPGIKWSALETTRSRDDHALVMELAQSKYLVAHTETDLQGQGFLRNIPPGNYWLSTLDVTASVGDARPRWDVPFALKPGKTAYIALSSSNAVRASQSSQ